MPLKKKGKKGKKGSGGKKKGKKDEKKSPKPTTGSSTSGYIDDRPPLLRPGEKLVNLLKSHPVDEKEVHGMKVTTRVLAELTPQEVRDLKVVFDIFDVDSDGFLAPIDLRRALKTLGFKISKDEATRVTHDISLRGKNNIDFNEFLEVVIDKQGDTRDIYDEILKGFELFDFDSSGHICLDKLKLACNKAGIKFTQQELEDMIEEADVNGDGHVDQSEFVRIMLQTNLF